LSQVPGVAVRFPPTNALPWTFGGRFASGWTPSYGSGSTLVSVGTTFSMRPSSSNVSRSMVVSRCVPSPPGMPNRW
jgi:hypothetical protein